jgi:general secretion pathway protein E/type IV pilus assembly protein PilB
MGTNDENQQEDDDFSLAWKPRSSFGNKPATPPAAFGVPAGKPAEVLPANPPAPADNTSDDNRGGDTSFDEPSGDAEPLPVEEAFAVPAEENEPFPNRQIHSFQDEDTGLKPSPFPTFSATQETELSENVTDEAESGFAPPLEIPSATLSMDRVFPPETLDEDGVPEPEFADDFPIAPPNLNWSAPEAISEELPPDSDIAELLQINRGYVPEETPEVVPPPLPELVHGYQPEPVAEAEIPTNPEIISAYRPELTLAEDIPLNPQIQTAYQPEPAQESVTEENSFTSGSSPAAPLSAPARPMGIFGRRALSSLSATVPPESHSAEKEASSSEPPASAPSPAFSEVQEVMAAIPEMEAPPVPSMAVPASAALNEDDDFTLAARAFRDVHDRKPKPTEALPEAKPAPRPPEPEVPAAIEPPVAPAVEAKPPAAAEAAPSATRPAKPNKSEERTGPKPLRLGEKLISLGLISEDQLQIALLEQRNSKKLLGSILVEMGFITESALGEVLAESAGTQKFDARSTVLDANLIAKVPKDVAIRNKVLPVSQQGDTIQLAMADVYNVLAIDQVRRNFPRGVKIVPVYCTETEILELIDQYYDYEMSVDGILREIETGIREKSLDGTQDGYVNPTVRLVNALLVDAIKSGASDIHFEPEGSFLRLRYRIDGQMVQVRSFHKDYWSAMVVRIKIMSGMNIAETRNPQDGRISFNVLGREVDFRVASQPTVHGENIVMRLLDKKKSLVPLEKLGFSDHNVRLLKKLLKRPEGIIIVTGPTGSGKTTTLYSVLSYINSIDVNIMTLEDPVEYQLPLIRQTNVREGSVDFSTGIRSLMRQDPDIIFVGEVRDEETALMAVRAALTGHQVYSTLHTNDAMGAIPRLRDIGIPSHLLAGTLICAMAQRLARKLCNACKRPRLATPAECGILGCDPVHPPNIYEPVGCPTCNNRGYKGRTAIIEILRIDKGFDELIATEATRNTMMEYALESGFIPMVNDGIDKVMNGEIDLEELINTIDMTDRL